jgi:hypothetical protein
VGYREAVTGQKKRSRPKEKKSSLHAFVSDWSEVMQRPLQGFITQDPFHLSFRMQNPGSNLIMLKILPVDLP